MESSKLLIIEDDIATLGDLEMRIGEMGYKHIKTAVTGEEAVEIAETFQPGIILADINLGEGMSGTEAVRQIQEKQDVPVVYLTAYGDDQTLNAAGITEPYGYIVKPFQERELQMALSIAQCRHKVENELKEANAVKDRFISLLAHDLKNHFNRLMGYTELLANKSEKYDKSKIKKYAEIIHNSAQQTHKLLMNLLEWSRSQEGRIPFNPQKTNLYYLVYEPVTQMEEMAREKQITLHFEAPEEWELKVDSNMITAVIRNLLSNAIKYTPEGGEIHVTATANKETAQIAVTDTGIGMDGQTQKNLFNIGKMRTQAGTNNEKGTGFGLLLCKEFTDKHNGALHVDSEPGKGSTFTVALPLK